MHPVSHSWHIIHLWSNDLTLRTEYNDKSTIPEDSDEKHYYYGYSIPRRLIYSSHASSFLGVADSSTALAMDLPPLLVVAE